MHGTVVQKFYDSESAALREFIPLVSGKASLYYCGATVQGAPHLGHIRSALVYDQITRWLRFQGLEVTLLRNVTDIDDKILTNAHENDEPWWALAYRNEREFSEVYRALNIQQPTYEPRATGHIPEMQQLIRKLMDRGHAYAADDGSGDVYFDVASFSGYGELTHQKIEDMQEEETDPSVTSRKRQPQDFALWKGTKPGEPRDASWPSPWGAGRPGWHLECSAMSEKYLGSTFDIHGGGIDLRFPHHENERAQSKASGAPFANFWLHNGWVTYQGDKMSKSIGNVIDPINMLNKYPMLALRYYLGSAHYRSALDYHPDALKEATAAVEQIDKVMLDAAFALLFRKVSPKPADRVPEPFKEALEEDMNVPAALAVIHEHVRDVRSLLPNPRSGLKDIGDGAVGKIQRAYGSLAAMLDVLAINPRDGMWCRTSREDQESIIGLGVKHRRLSVTVKNLKEIADRSMPYYWQDWDEARKKKDWEKSDEIRGFLAQRDVSLEDYGPDGTGRIRP